MFARLERVIDEAVSAGRIVGVVYLVARDGEIVFAAERGFADREDGRPVRRDTLFRLASVTKPFVAAAALAMMDRGLIGLDDPVSRYLPYFTPRLADGSAPRITLRHLLTHTAGLSYDYGAEPDFSDGLSDTDFDFEENFIRLARRPLKFAPGSGWEYSVAIDVLGAALAQVEGATLDEVIKRHVTGPLDISARASMSPTAPVWRRPMPTPHRLRSACPTGWCWAAMRWATSTSPQAARSTQRPSSRAAPA